MVPKSEEEVWTQVQWPMKVDKIPKVSKPGRRQRKAVLDYLPTVSGALWLDLTDLKGLEARESSVIGNFSNKMTQNVVLILLVTNCEILSKSLKVDIVQFPHL